MSSDCDEARIPCEIPQYMQTTQKGRILDQAIYQALLDILV